MTARSRPPAVPDDATLSSVAVEVLLTLADGQRHGYAIKQAIETRIGGDFVLGSGSLYQALQRLERRGLVAAVDAPSPDERRGRVYRLEPAGRRVLAAELGRMERLVSHARRRRLAIGPERS
ncbi:MAG: helix-turn-helix transcriptional regulator [Vicinamibacterales bacterium]